MQLIGEAALALAMIAAFLLAWFGARLVRQGEDHKRGILMLVAAAVWSEMS